MIERGIIRLARRCESADDFARRLEAGEAIGIGSPVIARDLPRGGRVTADIEIGPKKIPAWRVRLPGGGEDVIIKEYARHMHGLALPADKDLCEAVFQWLKAWRKKEGRPS